MKQIPLSLVLWITTLLFVVSCSTNHNMGNVILFMEYDIATSHSRTDPTPGFMLQIQADSRNHLISRGIRHSSNQCIIYDLTDGKVIDSIDLNTKPYMEVYDAVIVGKDSILIALNAVYDNDFHDESILLIDRNKNILDTFDLSSLPVRTRNNIMEDNSTRHYVSYAECPLLHHSQHFFIPILAWSDTGISSQSLIRMMSYAPGHKNMSNELPISFPKVPKGFYWPSYYRSPHGTSSEDVIYFFFSNSPVLFCYNPEKSKLSREIVSFQTIGDILPYRIGETAKPFDAYRSRYENIVYDPTHQLLYMTAKIACDSSDGPLSIQRENAIYSFVILDKKMRKIGEGIIPDGHLPYIIPYKKGFLLSKKNTPQTTYIYYTYSFDNRNKNYLRDLINTRRAEYNKASPKLTKKEAVSSYLKRIIGENISAYSSFLLLSESACPHCTPQVSKILLRNKYNILTNEVAIVMINTDTRSINDFCKSIDGIILTPQQKLTISDKIPIYCDTNNSFHSYFEYWVNYRYISFDKNGEIITDTIINPSSINDLNDLLQPINPLE